MATTGGPKLHGPWLWAWAVWNTAWLFVLLWGYWLWGTEGMRKALTILYTVFLPLEVGGALDLRDDPPSEPRTAKTLSQWMFRARAMSRSRVALKSWNALVTGVAAAHAFATAWLIWPWNAGLAVIIGVAIFLWLEYHFIHPERYG